MLSFILGYFTNEHTYESILGFLSTFAPGQPPSVIFNYVEYIADNIHDHLVKFPTEGVFRYTSFLFHMLLYFQAYKFPITIQKFDIEENPLSVIFWTSLIRKESTKFNRAEFTDHFVHPLINMLTNTVQPRISDEIKKILQLSEQTRTGDWYLYEKHTEIRVFGSNNLPYKLPKYVPMRVFALEYIRQILNSYSINFLAAKKKTQFKLKNQVGPFICNHRDAENVAAKQLLEYRFEASHGTMIHKEY